MIVEVNGKDYAISQCPEMDALIITELYENEDNCRVLHRFFAHVQGCYMSENEVKDWIRQCLTRKDTELVKQSNLDYLDEETGILSIRWPIDKVVIPTEIYFVDPAKSIRATLYCIYDVYGDYYDCRYKPCGKEQL